MPTPDNTLSQCAPQTDTPKVTEREVYEERQSIVQTLHKAYVDLFHQMAPFRQSWMDDPVKAVTEAAADVAGGPPVSGADPFSKETWTALGEQARDAAKPVYNAAHVYARSFYRRFSADLNALAGHNEDEVCRDVMAHWAWEDAEFGTKSIKPPKNTPANCVAGPLSGRAAQIIAHRTDILGLPYLLAVGDFAAIGTFIDTVVRDIDPPLAAALSENLTQPATRELIADEASLLPHLAYAVAVFETVPPNYYVHAFGRDAVPVMLDTLLCLCLRYLTGSSAAAASIDQQPARWAEHRAACGAAPGEENGSARKGWSLFRPSPSRMAEALPEVSAAFQQCLTAFANTADAFAPLGKKLITLRRRRLGLPIEAGEPTPVEIELPPRLAKCIFCHSPDHYHTPTQGHGVLHYE